MTKAAQPRVIVMLAFEGAQVLDVVGPLQMLAGANDERATPAYRLTLLAERRGPFRTSGGLILHADGDYSALPKTIDTLMIAGGNIERALEHRELNAAVRSGALRSRRIVSICTGTFFLAAAGLLKGKRATTHWRAVDRLAELFPRVRVERDAIFVRDGRVWTSAGVTA